MGWFSKKSASAPQPKRNEIGLNDDVRDVVIARKDDLKKTDEQVAGDLTAGVDSAAIQEIPTNEQASFVGPENLDKALSERRRRGFETVTRDIKQKALVAGRQKNIDRQSSMATYSAQRDKTRMAAYENKIADQQAANAAKSSALSSILGLVGTGVGMFFGGPVGAMAGGAVGAGIGKGIGGASANKVG